MKRVSFSYFHYSLYHLTASVFFSFFLFNSPTEYFSYRIAGILEKYDQRVVSIKM